MSNNVTFLLDISDCKLWDDWKCDDMGAWRNNGVKGGTFVHDNGIVKATRPKETVHTLESGTVYTLVRMYYKNKTASDVKKCVSYLEGMLYFVLLIV